MANWLYVLAGMYLMAMGFAAKSFLGGSEDATTDDDTARAQARPVRRVVVVLMGLLILLYGTYRLARYYA